MGSISGREWAELEMKVMRRLEEFSLIFGSVVSLLNRCKFIFKSSIRLYLYLTLIFFK